jgi:hypothetical protein
MKYIILFYIIYLILKINYTYSEKSYLRFRNSLLATCIVNDKEKIRNEYGFKIINKSKNKMDEYYQRAISKIHDINLFYHSLSPEEREFIDTIISLCY